MSNRPSTFWVYYVVKLVYLDCILLSHWYHKQHTTTNTAPCTFIMQCCFSFERPVTVVSQFDCGISTANIWHRPQSGAYSFPTFHGYSKKQIWSLEWFKVSIKAVGHLMSNQITHVICCKRSDNINPELWCSSVNLQPWAYCEVSLRKPQAFCYVNFSPGLTYEYVKALLL